MNGTLHALNVAVITHSCLEAGLFIYLYLYKRLWSYRSYCEYDIDFNDDVIDLIIVVQDNAAKCIATNSIITVYDSHGSYVIINPTVTIGR